MLPLSTIPTRPLARTIEALPAVLNSKRNDSKFSGIPPQSKRSTRTTLVVSPGANVSEAGDAVVIGVAPGRGARRRVHVVYATVTVFRPG